MRKKMIYAISGIGGFFGGFALSDLAVRLALEWLRQPIGVGIGVLPLALPALGAATAVFAVRRRLRT